MKTVIEWIWKIVLLLGPLSFLLYIMLLAAVPKYQFDVAPAEISHRAGLSYRIELPQKFPYFVPSDKDGLSVLQFRENGKAFAPHARHVDIEIEGGERFSHWGQEVYFSSSDKTDPRNNTRVYSVDVKGEMIPSVELTLLLIVGLFLVFSFIRVLNRYLPIRAPRPFDSRKSYTFDKKARSLLGATVSSFHKLEHGYEVF